MTLLTIHQCWQVCKLLSTGMDEEVLRRKQCDCNLVICRRYSYRKKLNFAARSSSTDSLPTPLMPSTP